MDSEWNKMRMACLCKINRNCGFEGCANLGKGCDFHGVYLYTYSPEGLCDNCEFKEFPERYHGCCFCRKALKFGLICYNCRKCFQKWAFDLFYNKNERSRSTNSCFALKTDDETNDWNLWQCVSNGIHRLTNHSIPKLPFLIHERSSINNNHWPGFHLGNLQWRKFDPFHLKKSICIKDIKWDNSEDILQRELDKLGINIYNDVQVLCPKL
jgi:hypothetical protein